MFSGFSLLVFVFLFWFVVVSSSCCFHSWMSFFNGISLHFFRRASGRPEREHQNGFRRLKSNNNNKDDDGNGNKNTLFSVQFQRMPALTHKIALRLSLLLWFRYFTGAEYTFSRERFSPRWWCTTNQKDSTWPRTALTRTHQRYSLHEGDQETV